MKTYKSRKEETYILFDDTHENSVIFAYVTGLEDECYETDNAKHLYQTQTLFMAFASLRIWNCCEIKMEACFSQS